MSVPVGSVVENVETGATFTKVEGGWHCSTEDEPRTLETDPDYAEAFAFLDGAWKRGEDWDCFGVPFRRVS